MEEKTLANLNEMINIQVNEIVNLELTAEEKEEKLKVLKTMTGIVLAADKSAQEQQKIDNVKAENERKLSNEEKRIDEDIALRQEELKLKRDELEYKKSQLEQASEMHKLDCETRIKEAKWGMVHKLISEGIGIGKFGALLHNSNSMYRTECVIQHKEMNITTPKRKEIDKQYYDLIKNEVK